MCICLKTRSLMTLRWMLTCIIVFYCECVSKVSSNLQYVLVYETILQFNLVCLLSLILLVLYYIILYCIILHLILLFCIHLRHIVQYICAIVFKRIFWNKPTVVTVTLNAYICVQGEGGWRIGPKIRTY